MDTAVYPQQEEEEEEEGGGYSAKLVRCRADLNLPSSLGYWILGFLRSLSCQTCLQSKAILRKKAVNATGRRSKSKRTFSHFVHKIPLNEGILSSLNDNNKCDAVTKCCASLGLVARTSGLCLHSLGVQRAAMDNLFPEDRSARQSIDCGSSTLSADTSSEALSFGIGEMHYDRAHGDDLATSSEGSSPLGWPLRRTETSSSGIYDNPLAVACGNDSVMWPETSKKRETDLSEVEMMKERFSKLLLGEDMSGGGKGVCTALAISNAITNLSATVFGQLWRLEPLALEKKTMWHREMEWLLSVSDYIVELIPAKQNFENGSCIEVMVTRPRSDMCLNLPALRKLDAMLLEILDSFSDTEFWYVDQGLLVQDADVCSPLRWPPQRQEDKWWLPIPRVPPCGLCYNARKQLQHQRECTSQILKASMAINSSILSEMEVPEIYLEALPKSGKASLGDIIYRYISAEQFSPDCLLDCLDLSSEHHTLNIANRVEAAIQIWRQKLHGKHSHNAKENRPNSKSAWVIVKDLMGDLEKREMLADRAESLLLSLKQRFPGLSQTVLDMSKIQYNKDVGQSILESYSRVLESLAFNVIARIDDVLYVDDLTKHSNPLQYTSIPPSISNRGGAACKAVPTPFSGPLPSNTPYATAFATPNFSPTPLLSPVTTANSPIVSSKVIVHNFMPPTKVLPDCLADDTRITDQKTKDPARLGSPAAKEMGRNWSYAENVESRKALNSSLTRD